MVREDFNFYWDLVVEIRVWEGIFKSSANTRSILAQRVDRFVIRNTLVTGDPGEDNRLTSFKF